MNLNTWRWALVPLTLLAACGGEISLTGGQEETIETRVTLPDGLAAKSDGGSLSSQSLADGGPASQTVSDFSICKTQVSAAEVELGSSVTLTVLVRDVGEQTLANGQLWIEAISPSRKSSISKSTGVNLELGTETMITQTRGPLTEAGDWSFVVTLRDSQGVVLADGPSNRAQVVVLEPLAKLEDILRGAARFSYCSACQDGACMVQKGCGSCWAMSDYLCNELAKAKIKSRVIQYATAYSSNHRSVQYWDNGWVDVPYRAYGINMLFNSTSSKPGMFEHRLCYQ